MNRIVTLAACVTVCAALAPAGAQTTIDFDTLPGGVPVANNTTISTQYAFTGVVFSQFEDGSLVLPPLASRDFIGGAGSGNGLFNVQGNIFPITNANRTDDLRLTFLAPVSGVRFITNGFKTPPRFRRSLPTARCSKRLPTLQDTCSQ